MVSIIYPSCYPGNTHRASAQEFIHRSHELDQSKFKIATATFGVILAAGGVAVGVAVFCVGTPVVAAAVATVTALSVANPTVVAATVAAAVTVPAVIMGLERANQTPSYAYRSQVNFDLSIMFDGVKEMFSGAENRHSNNRSTGKSTDRFTNRNIEGVEEVDNQSIIPKNSLASDFVNFFGIECCLERER
jgi:hypothetical protein